MSGNAADHLLSCMQTDRIRRDNMDWVMGMQRAIDYVEEHITEELDYDEIARQS